MLSQSRCFKQTGITNNNLRQQIEEASRNSESIQHAWPKEKERLYQNDRIHREALFV